MAIPAIRNNNAGNLRPPDEATGRRWWGKHGFVGLDGQGFAIFETPQGGLSALDQQVRSDQKRGLTQTEFIDKYVGAEADPQGTANAQRNIPQFTGAPPDTAIADIDKDALVRAITRSEGGQDSLQHFGLDRGNFLALDRAQGQRGQRQEADSLIGKLQADTDLPRSDAAAQLLPVDARIEKEKEAARLAQRPKAEIAPGHTVALEDAPNNLLKTVGNLKRGQPLDIGLEVKDPFGARAALGGDATAAERQIVARETLKQDVKDQRQGGTPMTTVTPSPWSSEPVDPRVADIEGELTGAEKEQYLLGTGGTQREVQEAVRTGRMPSGEKTIQQTQRDVAAKRPSTPISAQRADTLDVTADTPEDVDLMDVDLAGVAPPDRSLLQRLGGMIKDNPEVAAQIAQAAGGLMSNIARGRAQREAGKETEGRVARANLISALTGGKARPQVTAAQADEGGLLSRLGQITTAGGRIASGEMARRKAEGVQERELAAKELDAQSQADYRTAMADIGERQLDVDAQKNYAKFVTDYMKTMQDQAKESRLPIGELKELGSSFATLRKLDDLEDFIVGADFSALEMGPLSLDEPSQYIFGSDASVARSKIQGLIAEIAKTVPGVLTEQDQKRLEQRLLTLNDRESTAVDLAEAFRVGMIEEIQAKMDSYEKGGQYDVSYFRGELEDYGKRRGTEGLISALTQDELDLGYE